MKKRGLHLSMRGKEGLSGYLFTLPWIIGFLLFFGSNLFQSIVYSFNRIVFEENGGFRLEALGLDNYINAFTRHATFNQTLTESIMNMLIDVPLIIFLSLFVALILNRKFKLRGLVRAIFFLPVIMATSSITQALEASMRSMMGGISNIPAQFTETADAGLNVTFIFRQFVRYGIPTQIVEYLVAVIARMYDIIKASGVQILIFLAALQAIPGALYEVAQIEGATAYESFWKITFPMVSPLILTNVVYTIVNMYTASTVVQLTYTTAFTNLDFGLSSAMSLISAAAACLVLLVTSAVISAYTFYQN